MRSPRLVMITLTDRPINVRSDLGCTRRSEETRRSRHDCSMDNIHHAVIGPDDWTETIALNSLEMFLPLSAYVRRANHHPVDWIGRRAVSTAGFMHSAARYPDRKVDLLKGVTRLRSIASSLFIPWPEYRSLHRKFVVGWSNGVVPIRPMGLK